MGCNEIRLEEVAAVELMVKAVGARFYFDAQSKEDAFQRFLKVAIVLNPWLLARDLVSFHCRLLLQKVPLPPPQHRFGVN